MKNKQIKILVLWLKIKSYKFSPFLQNKKKIPYAITNKKKTEKKTFKYLSSTRSSKT